MHSVTEHDDYLLKQEEMVLLFLCTESFRTFFFIICLTKKAGKDKTPNINDLACSQAKRGENGS